MVDLIIANLATKLKASIIKEDPEIFTIHLEKSCEVLSNNKQ